MTADSPYLVGLGELLEDAAKLLFYSLPRDGWVSCTLDYREAGPVIEAVARTSDSNGNTHPVTPPSAVLDALEYLRKYMAEGDDGVWLSAQLKVESGRFAFGFNYTERLQWRVAPTDDAYVDDLSQFPRSENNTPRLVSARVIGGIVDRLEFTGGQAGRFVNGSPNMDMLGILRRTGITGYDENDRESSRASSRPAQRGSSSRRCQRVRDPRRNTMHV